MPNFTNHPPKISNADRAEIVRLYRHDKKWTTSSLAIQFGCSNVTIAKVLRLAINPKEYDHLKLLRNPRYRGIGKEERKRIALAKHRNRYERVDHACFDELNEQSVYWIGFLMADGNVYGNRISLCLCSKDMGHLRKFKKFTRCRNNIEQVLPRNACVVRFSSKRIASRLATFGVLPRKSLSSFFPEIPNELLRHYIRGVYDGDGSIHYSRKRWIIQIAGSKIYCKRIADILERFGIRALGPYYKWKGSKVYAIQIQSVEARKFLEWIYSDPCSTFLDRKYAFSEKGLT